MGGPYYGWAILWAQYYGPIVLVLGPVLWVGHTMGPVLVLVGHSAYRTCRGAGNQALQGLAGLTKIPCGRSVVFQVCLSKVTTEFIIETVCQP